MHVSYVALCLGLLNGSLFDVKVSLFLKFFDGAIIKLPGFGRVV